MNIKEKFESLRQNRIALNIDQMGKYSPCATRFGGQPDVPRDFVWPTFKGKDYDDVEKERPLAFLAQFNCADLSAYDTEHILPDHGLLSFFYELDTQCWGFNPKDKGCARVYWFEDTSELSAADFPEDMEDDFKLPILNIKLSCQASYPSIEDFSRAFPDEKDDDAVYEVYNQLLDENSDTYSQLLGWPDVIQSSMYSECDLVTKGYYLGGGWLGIDKEDRKLAEETAHERWQLLFQLDTVECDDFELMFGDCGHIYFFITKEDLAARRFDHIWLILQCC